MVLLAACSSGAKTSGPNETLNQMCVRETRDLYARHSLPTTHPASEQPAICAQTIKDNDITTKAQLEILLRQADAELDAIDPE